MPQVVVEGVRGSGALDESGDLVRDSWWRIFGIWLAVGVIAWGATGAPELIVDTAIDLPDAARLVVHILLDAAGYSFAALAGTLLYFDVRARHDRPFEPGGEHDAPGAPVPA